MARPSSFAKPLGDLIGKQLDAAFRRQGFATRELVTRWSAIIGADLARHCEPLKIQWSRVREGEPDEPATLVLRVEGPVAIEIQHASDVILARVNQFLGWPAVGRIAIRQAPIGRRDRAMRSEPPPAAVAAVRATLGRVNDDDLKTALARLGAAVRSS